MKNYNHKSTVEEIAAKRFKKELLYAPYEKIKTVEVPNFPSLGKITALRFIEWLQMNKGGVISLPTGKTPEFFIAWSKYFLGGWEKREVREELEKWSINPAKKPDMKSYWFVQIDEFYPMNPKRENSFSYYIKKFYMKGLGLDSKKCMLIDTWHTGAPEGKTLADIFPDGRADLSLRYRIPKNEAENLQQKAIFGIDAFAMEYENSIDRLGGIGFFLGGIGPDGHIAFNIKGSDHNSATRVLNINYETAAAAAADLGGIEMSRDKAAFTVGLATITKNPTVTAIIMAAGESKAAVVKNSIEGEPFLLHPATSLQKRAGARFYITAGAASLLTGRKLHAIKQRAALPYAEKEKIVADLTLKLNKNIKDISPRDLREDIFGAALLGKDKNLNLKSLAGAIIKNYSRRIERGVQEVKNKVFLHTAPHHDDIMLGYLPYILHLVRQPTNSHFFATLTSGFTSITNFYTLSMLDNMEHFVKAGLLKKIFGEKDYFSRNNTVAKNRDIYQYLDGVAANSREMQQEGEARRTFRDVAEIAGTAGERAVMQKAGKLKRYLLNSYPGKKDIQEIQMLKGMIREWEEELLWAHLGFSCENIRHLRLGFYTGDIFTPKPQWERDVKPFLALLEQLNPDIITVAFDPEGTGPDTHYKVLQIISRALQKYYAASGKKLKIWGYRNVWYRFHPSEANIYVPVSMNSLAIMKSAFEICFSSQKSASFPSYEHDGLFSELAQKIMVEQRSAMKKVLGRDFFGGSKFARIRASRGVNFIREMEIEEFLSEAQNLRKVME